MYDFLRCLVMVPCIRAAKRPHCPAPPENKTKAEIETTLTRYGATRFAYFVEPKGAVIMFEVPDRRLRFNLPPMRGSRRWGRGRDYAVQPPSITFGPETTEARPIDAGGGASVE
jgi:hypothetical protein